VDTAPTPRELCVVPSFEALCEDLPLIPIAAGQTLLTENEHSGRLYVLVEGAVEIVTRGVQVNVVTEPGAIFGEMSALLGDPHMASVRALAPSTVRLIEGGEAFLKLHPELSFELAKLLAHRLRGVTSYLVDLKRQFETHADHLGMVDEILEALAHEQKRTFTPGSDRDPGY
jgi:CRP/FNR family transcriptional regulator, cyclic AMP receptor protein